jgi:hypothetical protein
MKTTITTAALALAAIAVALSLGACAGTILTVSPDGTFTISAAPRAIIVEATK